MHNSSEIDSLPVKKAAEYLGMSQETLYRRLSEHPDKLRILTGGTSIRIPIADLDAYRPYVPKRRKAGLLLLIRKSRNLKKYNVEFYRSADVDEIINAMKEVLSNEYKKTRKRDSKKVNVVSRRWRNPSEN